MASPNIILEPITTGSHWLEFKKQNLRILCGSPPDISKHLIKKNYVREVEIDGIKAQTGPNAILLSDSVVQGGEMRNLIEFPVLQMFYFQGTLLPGHPNNKPNNRPILIGVRDHLEGLMSYIFRGNYGLIDEEDFVEAGMNPEITTDLICMKLKFAFGKFKSIDQMINKVFVSSEMQLVRDGIYVKRLSNDLYLFQDENESIEIDMSIKDKSIMFQSTYSFPPQDIPPAHFSVIDSGSGDGWDPNRPCFSAMLQYRQELYMIDAGPSIRQCLHFLNQSATDIKGVFVTHGHDDHVAGLTSFMSKNKAVTLFSTKLVRLSVTKKITALLGMSEKGFQSIFNIVDLEYDTWNNLNGLEVMPLHSPHPVDSCIYVFRVATGNSSYKTYAHVGDICSFKVLEGLLEGNNENPGCSKNFVEGVKRNYLMPVDLKKIDIGGGMIHGEASDFADDISRNIVFGHTNTTTLTETQAKIGKYLPFGTSTILIKDPPS